MTCVLLDRRFDDCLGGRVYDVDEAVWGMPGGPNGAGFAGDADCDGLDLVRT